MASGIKADEDQFFTKRMQNLFHFVMQGGVEPAFTQPPLVPQRIPNDFNILVAYKHVHHLQLFEMLARSFSIITHPLPKHAGEDVVGRYKNLGLETGRFGNVNIFSLFQTINLTFLFSC